MQSELQEVAGKISQLFRQMETEYRSEAIAALRALERLDPETAWLTVEVLGSRSEAALWLTEHLGPLCGERPWDYIARGQGDEIRRVLNAIKCDLPV